ncbi:CoA pyrophosphatase [Clostridium sp. MD294]|uniref:NUDIX hydrolase n=1 Tax=Clostridium sp. MD294 TaxID=97138 RepID=UPI0002CB36F6|nr:CoA pyrophosphatase [Clostridium sp. MD294]NDO46193.1 CoA pyrophosphatase [Clostridium sp. MD294]USF30140.1 putative Nudix hydrolase NudL [Clostridium sp. MD294]
MKYTNTYIKNIKNKLQNNTPKPIMKYLPSAVMLLLFCIDDEIHLLFTKRSEKLLHQPGDISFPGGRGENNETPLQTALRETQEELGISPDNIAVLGCMDFVLTTFGTIIMPFVGFVSGINIKDIHFSKEEVDEIFTVPISFFKQTEPEIHYLYFSPFTKEDFPYERIHGGKNYTFATPKIPELFYQYQQYTIWGITAQITHHAITSLFS